MNEIPLEKYTDMDTPGLLKLYKMKYLVESEKQ
jgi:hypothetical protein